MTLLSVRYRRRRESPTMSQTLHDRYIAALALKGWREAHSLTLGYAHPRRIRLSTKYTVLVKQGATRKLFIGRSGAVRIGTTVTNSYPISDGAKERLLSDLAASGNDVLEALI